MSSHFSLMRFHGVFLLERESKFASYAPPLGDHPPGTWFRLTCYFSFDESQLPDWRQIPGATALARMGADGRVWFCLSFGPTLSPTCPPSVCPILLPRHSPGSVRLPRVALIVRQENVEQPVSSEEVRLVTSWSEAVFLDGCTSFRPFLCAGVSRLPTQTVVQIMMRRFKQLFNPLAVDSQAPELSSHVAHSMLRLALKSTSLPEYIEKKYLVGKGGATSKTGLVWSLFQTVAELAGRSHMVRSLLGTNELCLLLPGQAVGLAPELLAELHTVPRRVMHLLRVPRKVRQSAALAIELFVFEDGKLNRMAPTPYLTPNQLERAQGHIYQAAAALDSVHADVLRQLSPRYRLKFKGRDPFTDTPSRIERVTPERNAGLDAIQERPAPNWWVAAKMPPPLAAQ